MAVALRKCFHAANLNISRTLYCNLYGGCMTDVPYICRLRPFNSSIYVGLAQARPNNIIVYVRLAQARPNYACGKHMFFFATG